MSASKDPSPDLVRRFQYTDLNGNSNKEWTISAWDLGNGQWRQVTEYCRVGHSPQRNEKTTTRRKIDSLIRRKQRKGYVEVQLAVQHDGAVNTGDERVDDLVANLFAEAGAHIKTYLVGDVGQLSKAQINAGHNKLDEVRQLHEAGAPFQQVLDAVEDYYRTIPTRLPHRIKPEKVVEGFVTDLHEQEERLEQLSAAIQSLSAADNSTSTLDVVGAEIACITGTQEAEQIAHTVSSTIEHRQYQRSRIGDVFQVHIPSERAVFEKSKVDNVQQLFHGSAAHNGRHILRTGLIIPRSAANGSMFGRGIYFADKSSKSMGYAKGSRLRTLFVADVRLGQRHIAGKPMKTLTSAPAGYDSVLGKAGHTSAWGGRLRYNEFVVYQTSQQTITHLVTFEV